MTLRWLLCDLDGTLADTMGALRHAYAGFCSAHGITASDAEFAALNGPPLNEVVRRLAATHGLRAPLQQLQADYHRQLGEAYAFAPPMRGMSQLFSWAAAQSLRIAVVTGSARDSAEAWLRRQQVWAQVELLVAGDDGHAPKPDPACYRAALARAGVDAFAAVALEDSSNGVRAATAAGVRTIQVAPPRSPRAACAATTVQDLTAAVEELQRSAWIVARGAVSVETDERAHPSDASPQVAALWQAALLEKPFLFDGSLLSLDAWTTREGGLLCRTHRCAYRSWMAQRRGLELGVRPLGVTGVVRRNGLILCGQRSQLVSSDPGCWEPVPCGSLDPGREPGAHVLHELQEETGLSGSVGAAWGLVEHDGVIDIVLPLTLHESSPLPRLSHEHVQLAWRSPTECTGREWIPVAAAIATLAAEHEQDSP